MVETSKTKDPFLVACIRNIWLITATFAINLEISHVRGVDNDIADLLSRLYSQKFVNSSLYADLQTNYTWHKVTHLISGSNPSSLQLLDSSWQKIDQAYRPFTSCAHRTHFRTFIHILYGLTNSS